jgi:hypothetical protein
MAIEIKKAVRQRVWLKLGITGPSGSGKTFGGIGLGKGLAKDGRVCVIDTENESASLYAEEWDYDVICMHAPFTTQKYIDALEAVIAAGYDVVVIDSLSHEWAASGGILDKKTDKDLRGGNSFTNWGEMKQQHNRFMERLLQAPIHVISTLRSKMEYVLETNEKGKQVPRKVGLAPISQDETEYEFSLLFDVERNSHLAIASKDRTGLYEGRNISLDESIGRELRAWLDGAVAPANEPTQKLRSTAHPITQTPPAEWVTAISELAEITVGMPDKTRVALIKQWESAGPSDLPALLEEIATIKNSFRLEPIKREEAPKEPPIQAIKSAQNEALERQKTPGQEASDFVDSLEPGNSGEDVIDPDQYEALGTLLNAYGINRDAFRAYCAKSGHLQPCANGPTLARLKASEFGKLRERLQNKRIAAKNETWSARTVRLINATPTTTFKPQTAA